MIHFLRKKWELVLTCVFWAAVVALVVGVVKRNVDKPTGADGKVAVAFSDSGANRAILIGVDDYFGADKSHDLKYASADVELMRERLLGLGFHPENIVALSTANGTKAPEFEPNLANVEKALADLLAKTRPNDSVFVFFSGHGFQTRKLFGLRNYVGFVASDSAWRADGRLDVSTTFSLSKFFNKLAKTEARFKWAVVDACRETLGPENAKGGVKGAALGDKLGVLKARSGLLIFQSCGDGQYSYEDDELKHSAFTYRLAESLGPEGDTNGDGAIKFLEAISRTTDKMADAKPRQEPALSCVETRDFVLISRLSTEPTETSNAAQTPETSETSVAKQTQTDVAPSLPAAVSSSDAEPTPPNAVPSSDAESTPPNAVPSSDAESTPPNAVPSSGAEPTPPNAVPSSGAEPTSPAAVSSSDAVPPKSSVATGGDVQTTSVSRTPESESARLYRLGRALAFGLDGRKIDEAAGFERLKQATDLGSLDAQAELAELYLNGCVGTKADPDEAFDLATAPAQAGNPFGQNVLALCYRDGLSPQRDEAKAEACFKDACVGFEARKNDDVRAATALGLRYLNGEGVVKDEKAAARLFLTAAEAGYVPAMRQVGACYAEGTGVEQDDKLAWKWLLKAAERNDALAMTELGACYARGLGVEQDAAEATKWYRQAAELGHAPAMAELGVCYMTESGVEQDEKEAMKWLRKAAALGNATALVRMVELENELEKRERERETEHARRSEHESPAIEW